MFYKFISKNSKLNYVINTNLLSTKNLSSKKFCFIWNKLKNVEQGGEKKEKPKNKYDYVELSFGSKARNYLKEGIVSMSETVAKTYGPLGKNVAIRERNDPVLVTKDGVTVASYIKFGNRKYNLGTKLLGSIPGSTNVHAGDGTTTSTVLAGEIVRKGVAMVDLGFHPLEVKKGIEIASKKFIEHLDKMKIKINSLKDLYNLAMVVSNDNIEVSNIISKALISVGIKGLIQIEESQTGLNDLIIFEGMFLPNGMASPEFLRSEGEQNLNIEDPLILIIREPITSIEHIINPLEYAKSINRPLIIFSPDIKKEPLSVLLYNKKKADFNCIAVNIPDHLEDSSNLENFEDISIMTGAKICTLKDVSSMENDENYISEEIFGAAKKSTLSELETALIGVKGDKEMISTRISNLRYQLDKEKNEFLKDLLRKRIGRLEGRHAVITIGGHTTVEIAEYRDKIVDCLNSCKTALDEGILPGGGASFIHALTSIEHLKSDSSDINIGLHIFKKAIINTLKHLYSNTDVLGDIIIEKVQETGKTQQYSGYNISKNKFSNNMIEEGIIDSYQTIRSSVEDSVSVASLIITTECIVFKEVNYEPPPLEAFKNKMKNDPQFRAECEKQFYGTPEELEDHKNFINVI